MAALTSGSWTIAYQNGDRRTDTASTDRLKFVDLKLTIVSGSYPLAGLNLPGFQSAGLVRRLDRWILHSPTYTVSGSAGATVSGALEWKLATGGLKVRPLRILKGTGTGGEIVPLVTTATVAAQTFMVTAIGW